MDEQTKVPLYAIAVCCPFLVAAIMWLASVDAKASAAASSSQEIRPMVNEILQRVIRLEEHLKQRR